MDARIQNETDLQKLVHCEILKAEHAFMNGALSLHFVLRSLDETMFDFFIVPGAEVSQQLGTAYVKPTMTYVTKEILLGQVPAGGSGGEQDG